MTDKLQVKDHLRNEVLYRPLYGPSPGIEWKCRLFYQYTLHRQIKTALWESPRLLKPFVFIGIPAICIVLVIVSYFEFIHPERWIENILPIEDFFEKIVPLLTLFENIGAPPSLDVPPIGLLTVLVFVAIVNALTFIVRKRFFAL